MKKGIVENWMSTNLVTVTPQTTLVDARQIIQEHNIRALPVVENEKLVGIVTRRGLLRLDLSFMNNDYSSLEVDPSTEIIGDIMTRNPITVNSDFRIPRAARIMLENKVNALPVVDNGKLVGIITNSDMMRFLIAEYPELKKSIPVSSYKTDEVVTIDTFTPLLEAHRLMGTKRIRSLPVVVEGKLVGIVTRTDLMSSSPSRLVSRYHQQASMDILTQPVTKVMTEEVTTIHKDQSVVEAARTFLEKKFHSLPVVDDENNLVGIITESDIFLMIVQKFN